MGDHDRTERTLTLLAQRGAYETLLAMHARGGTATLAQISSVTPQPLALLRAMAAEGFVVNLAGGTLDIDPRCETHFRLTGKGEAVFGHLVRLRHWLASRADPKRQRPTNPHSTANMD